MRAEKQLLLDEVVNQIKESKTFVITSYDKIDPNLDHDLRTSIAKAGGNYSVVKKRLLLKAASDLGITLDTGMLEGHIALATSNDEGIATTKALFDFTKENKDMLKVLGGLFEVSTIIDLPFKLTA